MDPFADLSNITLGIPLLSSILAAGLLGSVHCAGMCGPLAYFVSKNWRQNFVYNFSRLLGYVAIGTTFGYLGRTLLDSDIRWIRYLGATLMVLFLMLSIWNSLNRKNLNFLSFGQPVIRYAMSFSPYTRAFCVGVLTVLLPCGWLIIFAAASAASSSALAGGLIMGTFWISTLPVMSVVPLKGYQALLPFKNKYPLLAGAIVVMASLFVIGVRFYAKHSCH